MNSSPAGQHVVWQYVNSQEYYTSIFPCDAHRMGGFRTAIGEVGVEELLGLTSTPDSQAMLCAPSY